MQHIKHDKYVCNKHIVLKIDNLDVGSYKYGMNAETLYRHIGATIKRRRKQLGLTQERLAKQMSTSRASLANVETGRQNVLVHQLYGFAENLDLTIEDLLPPVVTEKPTSLPSDFPLPKGLNRAQREQIVRLLDGAPVVTSPSKERK